MWSGTALRLEMTEGDYGITLPLTVSGITMNPGDELALAVKTAKNGTTIIEQTMSVSEQTDDPVFGLVFSEEQSELLTPGKYFYILDWYRNGEFFCNIIPNGILKVVDKA